MVGDCLARHCRLGLCITRVGSFEISRARCGQQNGSMFAGGVEYAQRARLAQTSMRIIAMAVAEGVVVGEWRCTSMFHAAQRLPEVQFWGLELWIAGFCRTSSEQSERGTPVGWSYSFGFGFHVGLLRQGPACAQPQPRPSSNPTSSHSSPQTLRHQHQKAPGVVPTLFCFDLATFWCFWQSSNLACSRDSLARLQVSILEWMVSNLFRRFDIPIH